MDSLIQSAAIVTNGAPRLHTHRFDMPRVHIGLRHQVVQGEHQRGRRLEKGRPDLGISMRNVVALGRGSPWNGYDIAATTSPGVFPT